MQSGSDQAKQDKLFFLIGRGLFTILMAVSLFELWKIAIIPVSVLIPAREHWFTTYSIVMVWIALAVAGATVWAEASQKKMSEQKAGWLLVLLAGISLQSFNIIEKLAAAK